MTLNCDDARKWIPRDLVGDLGNPEQQRLQAHLRDCPSCCKEQELCADTVQQLASVSDVPVPHHFFVYPDKRRSSWLAEVFLASNQGWRVATVAGLALALSIGLAMSRFRFRVESGVYSFSFGRPLPSHATPLSPSIDLAALKAELGLLLETRSERERLELMNTLRKEFHEANRNLTRKQRRRVRFCLGDLGGTAERSSGRRIGGFENRCGSLDGQPVSNLAASAATQDLAMTRNRLDRITTQGQLKDRETEEILSTLLQVAQFQEK